jgi:hypothetical protein
MVIDDPIYGDSIAQFGRKIGTYVPILALDRDFTPHSEYTLMVSLLENRRGPGYTQQQFTHLHTLGRLTQPARRRHLTHGDDIP